MATATTGGIYWYGNTTTNWIYSGTASYETDHVGKDYELYSASL